jgi:coenzyme F420-reducing hydrogenase beta subunit
MVRESSTSGGVFSLLAKHVLDSGGVVFGAAWDDDVYRVRHISIATAGDLPRLQKSKYVWSDPLCAYEEAEIYIAKSRLVLFCGTPCQCAAIAARIKAKCGDKSKYLITVDFVCHGTPAPEVFMLYAKTLEKRHGGKLVAYDFRDKKDGWNFPRISYRFSNGKAKRIISWLDPYFRSFSLNHNLRECCYVCRFAGIDRPSDITIADCWRVGATHPDWDDNRGCSNVLINTERGLCFWDAVIVKGDMEWHDYDLREAQQRNHSLMEPSKKILKSRPLLYYWLLYWVKRIGWFYFRRHQ